MSDDPISEHVLPYQFFRGMSETFNVEGFVLIMHLLLKFLYIVVLRLFRGRQLA